MFTLIIILTTVLITVQEDTRVSQINRPFAEITDPGMIDFFLDEFLIPEAEVTRMEIIDITGNGFGPDDIVVTHPSMRAYIVEEPGEAALAVMRNWSLDDYRVDSDNIEPDLFDPEISGNENEAAQNAIIADLLRTLNRNYAQLPVRLRFERDEDGFTFEMWDFDEGALQYTPPDPLLPDSVFLYVTEYDTLMLTEPDTTVVTEYQAIPGMTLGDIPASPGAAEPDLMIDLPLPDENVVSEQGMPDRSGMASHRFPMPQYLIPRTDTVTTPGQDVYNVIYMSKTVVDTVFVPYVED